MKTNTHIIKLFTFIMIGIVAGTVICNLQLAGRYSYEAREGNEAMYSPMAAQTPQSPAVMPEDAMFGGDFELDYLEDTPLEIPSAPKVAAAAVLPSAIPESLPSVLTPALPESLPPTAAPEHPSVTELAMGLDFTPPDLSADTRNADDLPGFLSESPVSVAEHTPEPPVSFDLPGLPTLAELDTPQPVAQPSEAPQLAVAPPPPMKRARPLSGDDIYVSPWQEHEAAPQAELSHVAAHVGASMDNPLRPRAAAEPAPAAVTVQAPMVARVAPAAPQAPVQYLPTPVVQEPAVVSPQMGHGLPADISSANTAAPAVTPHVAAPTELPTSLPSEIPSLPSDAGMAGVQPDSAPTALASAAMAHPTLPVDGYGASPHTLPHTVQAADAAAQETPQHLITLTYRNTDIRRVIKQLQEKAGLGIYASVEVQGEITCDIQTADVDDALRRLLGATTYGYARTGVMVYIGRRNDVQDLPVPITERGGRRITPQYVSLEACERFVREHLSPYGECTRQDFEGRPCLVVKDMELALMEMDTMLELVDIPPVKQRLDAFVFERSGDDKKYLSLTKLADKAEVTLQEYVFQGESDDTQQIRGQSKSKGESKTLMDLFKKPDSADKKEKDKDKDKEKAKEKGKEKDIEKEKEKAKEKDKEKETKSKKNYQAYTLSHRIDAMLMALEDDKETTLISDRKGISRVLAGTGRMTYTFPLTLGDDKIEYTIVASPRKAPRLDPNTMMEDTPQEIVFDLECRRTTTDAPREKGVEISDPIRFPVELPLNHALILQGKMVAFPDEHNMMKSIMQSKRNTEMITLLVLREDERQLPDTTLSNVALKYLSGKCEQIGVDIARRHATTESDAQAREFLLMSKNLRKIRNNQ